LAARLTEAKRLLSLPSLSVRLYKQMSCSCAKLPDLFKLGSHAGLEQRAGQIAVGNWACLHRCEACGQLWRIDEWDKYQTQFAAKVPVVDGWESFDTTGLQKDFLVKTRGGLTNTQCSWAGCKNVQVKDVAYCADHLLQTGARE
jgi:hypothetical protein